MNDAPHSPPGTSRRAVLAALTGSAAAAALLLPGVPADARPQAASNGPDDLVYVGVWGQSEVHALRFDPVTGALTALGAVAQVTSSWVLAHPVLPVLYVAGSEQGGYIRVFRVDDTSGALDPLGEIGTEPTPTGSGGLSYIGLTQDARTLLVADFAAGSAATLPVGPDGSLSTVASLVQDTGSGPNPRQDGPHPHHVVIDPSHAYALVADFGADRVLVYDYDPATRRMSAGDGGPGAYATAPGSGPRRLLFHPNGRWAYLLSELTAELQVLAWDARHGVLTPCQALTTNAPGHTGTTSAAELAISHDGRYVYASNRGDNALVVYAVNPATGLLTEVQRISCAGVTPWSFSLHPGGEWLFVANEASGTVNLFRVDQDSGKLTDTGTSVPVPYPDCIAFRTHADRQVSVSS